MNKFRNALEEGKFAARIARQFFRAYRRWRDANPDEDVVYVYVGHPDMAAAIVKQSALWQRFAAWEQSQAVKASVEALDGNTRVVGAPNSWAEGPPGRVDVCNCAACTASRATREESKAYDA